MTRKILATLMAASMAATSFAPVTAYATDNTTIIEENPSSYDMSGSVWDADTNTSDIAQSIEEPDNLVETTLVSNVENDNITASGYMPEGAELVVDTVDPDPQLVNAVENYFKQQTAISIAKVFDISIQTNDGADYQPVQDHNKLLLNFDLENNIDNPIIFHVPDDGTPEIVGYDLDAVTVDSFSYYVIGELPDEANGETFELYYDWNNLDALDISINENIDDTLLFPNEYVAGQDTILPTLTSNDAEFVGWVLSDAANICIEVNQRSNSRIYYYHNGYLTYQDTTFRLSDSYESFYADAGTPIFIVNYDIDNGIDTAATQWEFTNNTASPHTNTIIDNATTITFTLPCVPTCVLNINQCVTSDIQQAYLAVQLNSEYSDVIDSDTYPQAEAYNGHKIPYAYCIPDNNLKNVYSSACVSPWFDKEYVIPVHSTDGTEAFNNASVTYHIGDSIYSDELQNLIQTCGAEAYRLDPDLVASNYQPDLLYLSVDNSGYNLIDFGDLYEFYPWEYADVSELSILLTWYSPSTPVLFTTVDDHALPQLINSSVYTPMLVNHELSLEFSDEIYDLYNDDFRLHDAWEIINLRRDDILQAMDTADFSIYELYPDIEDVVAGELRFGPIFYKFMPAQQNLHLIPINNEDDLIYTLEAQLIVAPKYDINYNVNYYPVADSIDINDDVADIISAQEDDLPMLYRGGVGKAIKNLQVNSYIFEGWDIYNTVPVNIHALINTPPVSPPENYAAYTSGADDNQFTTDNARVAIWYREAGIWTYVIYDPSNGITPALLAPDGTVRQKSWTNKLLASDSLSARASADRQEANTQYNNYSGLTNTLIDTINVDVDTDIYVVLLDEQERAWNWYTGFYGAPMRKYVSEFISEEASVYSDSPLSHYYPAVSNSNYVSVHVPQVPPACFGQDAYNLSFASRIYAPELHDLTPILPPEPHTCLAWNNLSDVAMLSLGTVVPSSPVLPEFYVLSDLGLWDCVIPVLGTNKFDKHSLVNVTSSVNVQKDFVIDNLQYGDYALRPYVSPAIDITFIDPETDQTLMTKQIKAGTAITDWYNMKEILDEASAIKNRYRTDILQAKYCYQDKSRLTDRFDVSAPLNRNISLYVSFFNPELDVNFEHKDNTKTHITISKQMSVYEAAQLYGVKLDKELQAKLTDIQLELQSTDTTLEDMEEEYPQFKSVDNYQHKYPFKMDALVQVYLDTILSEDESGYVHELTDGLSLTFSADELFDKSKFHLTGYKMYSVHNGEMYEVPCEYDENAHTFTIIVSKFSPFELVYSTAENKTNSTKTSAKSNDTAPNKDETIIESIPATPSVTTNPAIWATPQAKTPQLSVPQVIRSARQTWDNSNVLTRILAVLTLCALSAGLIIFLSKKKRK